MHHTLPEPCLPVVARLAPRLLSENNERQGSSNIHQHRRAVIVTRNGNSHITKECEEKNVENKQRE